MKIALFLGAGASMPFGKPTTPIMRSKLIEKFASASDPYYLRDFLRCEKFEDIEHVLQSIKDIKEFLEGYGGKFFSWSDTPLQINFQDRMRKFDSSFFLEDIERIDKIVKQEIFNHYSWKHEKNEGENLFKIYDAVFNFLKESSDKIQVFTTNYDQAIEVYSNKKDELRLVDGFKFNESSGEFIWKNGDFSYCDNLKDGKINVYLYKLHGSLNWKEHKSKQIEKTREETITSDPKFLRNMLIYPTLSPKDGYEEQPFGSLLKVFETEFQKIDVCIIIGFSFRDQHINRIFHDFSSRGKELIIISPSSYKKYKINFLGEELTEEESKNLTSGSIDMVTQNHGGVFILHHKLEADNIENIIGQIRDHLHSPT